jgi:predicted nucleic acid-binding protein
VIDVVVDTSVVVGLVDRRDSQAAPATALMEALTSRGVRSILLDCVVVEVVGVICRRAAERRAPDPVPAFARMFPRERVSLAYHVLHDRWSQILDEVQASGGAVNAHDVLILDYARRTGIPYLATLDRAMRGRGVQVLSTAEEVELALHAE